MRGLSTMVARLIALGFTAILAVVILLNSASSLLENRSPNRALRLNPINVNAQVNLLSRTLNMQSSRKTSAQKVQMARQVIALAPFDPRGYSLLAQVLAAQGQDKPADALFSHALSISGTELLALRWKLARALTRQDYPNALRNLHLMVLRFPDLWPDLLPVVLEIMRAPEGLNETAKTFAAPSRNRRLLLSHLRKDAEGSVLAANFLLALFGNNDPTLPPEISRTMGQLMALGATDQAMALFLFTQNEEDQKHAGFVFNSHFALNPDKGPFDWVINDTPGVEILRRETPPHGLEIRFRDSPARIDTVIQTVLLFGGHYQLSIHLDAQDFRSPDPLFVRLRCKTGDGTVLARVALPQGSYQDKTVRGEFYVQESQCPVQDLRITNQQHALDWAKRNSGSVLIHRVAIEKLEDR